MHVYYKFDLIRQYYDINEVPAVIVNEDGTNIADVQGNRLLTDTTVSGVVPVSDNGGSLTVDGPLTDAELRATAVPISDDGGSLTVDGIVTSNIGNTGGLALEVTTSGLRNDFQAEDFAQESTLTNINIILENLENQDGNSTVSASGIGVLGKTENDLFRFLQVEDTGKLVVASTPPAPPAGTTEFVLAVDESQLNVGAGGDVSSPHTTLGSVIASGVTLALQLITVGSEGDPSESGSKVEVYWREGVGPTDHLVERLYVTGETVTLSVPSITKARDGTIMTGNGVNTRLVAVRTRQSTAAEEVDFVIRGYTE